MKHSLTKYICILALFCNNPTLIAEQIITFFLKDYPIVSLPEAAAKLSTKIHKAGKIATNHTKNHMPPKLSGIFATYGGTLTVSDADGQISFARKHTKPFVYLLITPKATPMVMSGNTIHHWEFEEGAPIAVYKIEQHRNEDIRKQYWLVSKEPAPANNRIPLETILLFADPKYIYVPLGITLAKQSPHLILPDVYIKKGINLTNNALYLLNLSHYFGSVIPLYKRDKLNYLQHLTY